MKTNVVAGSYSFGWVKLKPGREGLWHLRDEQGLCLCMKSRGEQKNAHEWRKEPVWRDACPQCVTYWHAGVKEKRVEEPEVMGPKLVEEKSEGTKEEEYVGITELAGLLDRSYSMLLMWMKVNPSWGFVKGKGVPTSKLGLVEEYDKKMPRREKKQGVKLYAANSISLPPAEKTETVTAVVGFALSDKQKLIAALMGKTDVEFVRHCVETFVDDVKARLGK